MNKQQDATFITCPICGKKLKSLLTHVFYKHKMDWKTFKSLYPNCPYQVPNKKVKVSCPICGKEFNSKSALGTHMSYIHLKTASYGRTSKKSKTEGILCPICHKYFVNFSQHIELTHNLSWDKFTKDFNYKGPSRYITDSYRKHLSENKKNFYANTVRGKELKQQASEKFKTDKNIAKSLKARKKISKFASSRDDNFTYSGFGYNFVLKINEKTFHLKSFIEFCCLIDLLNANINFEYENVKIFFKDNNNYHHYYKTDFVIGNTIYEIKPFTYPQLAQKANTTKKLGNKNYKDIYNKYSIIKKYAENVGYKFYMVNHNEFCKKLNLYKHDTEYYKNKILEFFKNGMLKKVYLTRKKNLNMNLFIEDEKFKEFKNLIKIHYF